MVNFIEYETFLDRVLDFTLQLAFKKLHFLSFSVVLKKTMRSDLNGLLKYSLFQ